MKSINDFSLEEIQEKLQRARRDHDDVNEQIRILFAPETINEGNIDQVCDIYSRLSTNHYDSVVIVEVHPEVLDKKLPMPSNKVFTTSFGPVPVNDYLRNEFCDEDDDFFIHDEAFDEDGCLFEQLKMLQASLKDFDALSIKIADENHFIIKELAHVLEEILASRSALVVFCCDLEGSYQQEFQKVTQMVQDKTHSKLLNYLNSGESRITGTAAFVAGIMLAHHWDMPLNFLGKDADSSLLTAYAVRERVMY